MNVLYLNPITGRRSIAKLFLPVACPDDSVDGFRLRKLDLDPTVVSRVGDPAIAVPSFSIIQMNQFVPGVVGVIA